MRNRLSRARYFRGHGVHSPFVYSIVRYVFMCRKQLSDDCRIYDVLLAAGVARRRALELQNLFIHCQYTTFGLNRADVDMGIVMRDVEHDSLPKLAFEAAQRGATLVIMSPYMGLEREMVCREIVAQHHSTTVDNRAYLIIFNNHLPKQHFRI